MGENLLFGFRGTWSLPQKKTARRTGRFHGYSCCNVDTGSTRVALRAGPGG